MLFFFGKDKIFERKQNLPENIILIKRVSLFRFIHWKKRKFKKKNYKLKRVSQERRWWWENLKSRMALGKLLITLSELLGYVWKPRFRKLKKLCVWKLKCDYYLCLLFNVITIYPYLMWLWLYLFNCMCNVISILFSLHYILPNIYFSSKINIPKI